MKSLFSILTIFLALSAYSATWIIHAAKDNTTVAQAYDSTHSQETGEMVYYTAVWDFKGTGVYQETQIIDIDAEVSVWDENCGCINPGAAMFYIQISGPYKQYKNRQYAFVHTGGPNMLFPGEYWVDYAAGGIPRVLTSRPSDFGKWAWNGKVNPSYLSILSRKHKAT